MKKLIYERTFEINRTKELAERGRKTLAEIVYHLDTTDLDGIKSLKSIEELIVNPRKFYLSNLPKKESEMFGLQISPEKAFDLLDIPQITEIERLIKKADANAIEVFLEVGELDENGLLTINEEKLEKACDRFRMYAETERELKFFESYQKIIEGTLELIAAGVQPNTFLNHNGKDWLSLKGKTIEMNYKFFATHT